MAVKIRLMRMGKKKQPFYRVVAADSRSPRDGRFIEILGTYDPRREPSEVVIDTEKVTRWLNTGAKPTDTVARLLSQAGVSAPSVPSAPASRAATPASPAPVAAAAPAAPEAPAAAAAPAAPEAPAAPDPAEAAPAAEAPASEAPASEAEPTEAPAAPSGDESENEDES